jgi:hypothetical protein
MVAPDALLFSLLARVSASIPPSWVLPAFVGNNTPASLCVAVVGRSGQGKSAANSAARDLLNISHPEYRFDFSLGTGQGLIEAYLRPTKKHEEGYEDGLKVQRFLGCHFEVDEGSSMVALANKKEDITLDTIRSLWSGSPVGQTNASTSTSRYLPANSAAFGLQVGFQPEVAATFVTVGAGLGTPQRFLWANAESPDQLDEPPEARGQLHVEILPHTQTRQVFAFDASIAIEVRRRRAAIQRGDIEIDPLEAHDVLKRMKVAACLARLEGEIFIDPQRWELARMITEVSTSVLQDIREQGQKAEQARREEQNDHKVESALRLKEKSVEACVRSGAMAMARRLRREISPLPPDKLYSATSSDDRSKASRDQMLEHLLREQWAEEIPRENQTPLYKAGKVAPPDK